MILNAGVETNSLKIMYRTQYKMTDTRYTPFVSIIKENNGSDITNSYAVIYTIIDQNGEIVSYYL